MHKLLSLISGFLLASPTLVAQPALFDCNYLSCFDVNSAMPNSCEEFSFYMRISSLGPVNFPVVEAIIDFGDGTPPETLSVVIPSLTTVYPETTHVYDSPGLYNVTLFVRGGNGNIPLDSCGSIASVQVEVTGGCEICDTYTVLSTGYDPGTGLPITSTSLVPGSADPNWTVERRYDLSSPSYTPIPSTILSIGNPAYVIYPKDGFCPAPLGRSRFISVNSLHNSSYGTPNIHTYRRYFNLPATLPSLSMYSLLMNLRAEDYVFDVQLNGFSISSNTVANADGSIKLNVNSCSGAFTGGSNFIDITVADINGGSTQLDAEIILYECPLMTPCPKNSGWSHTYSWNTNWGSWWYYEWYSWYCYTFGSYSGAPCPTSYPLYPPCPGCTGGGTGGGWGWGYIHGFGMMWVQGGDSGSVTISCPNCIPSFAPTPGSKYLLSAWVKEKNAPQSRTGYTYPEISLIFPSVPTSLGPFTASGPIVDGWQRLETEFTIPSGASSLEVKLDCTTGDCYYDDIRVFPFDGSMKSYVYDPVSLRLVAELDERNYATLYEYDEEGKLIRVKKETEKGKMTIKENRDNTHK